MSKNRSTLPNAIKKRVSKPKTRKRAAPRTAAEFFAKPQAFQDRLTRVAHAVSKIRNEGASLAHASAEYRLTPRTVLRWGRTGLRKLPNGRYVARASDKLLRVTVVLTKSGKQEIATRDSRQTTLIAEHWNAADKYLSTGDTTELRKLQGKTVTGVDGTKYPLLTDTAELDRLGNAGVLSFESIYARVA